MHVNPSEDAQQSTAVTHFSYSSAHPIAGGGTQTEPPPSPPARQKPVQHWSPVSQLAPFLAHGSSTQKPRMLPASSS